MENEKKPLIIVTGPTASGKSGAALELAKRLNGQIVSADSMQVYKGMDIGTAKITAEKMKDVKHYLIDIISPNEEFNVSEFVKNASQAIEEIYSNGYIPIVAGGTAFYIQALLKGVAFDEQTGENKKFRNDADELYKILDDDSYDNILKRKKIEIFILNYEDAFLKSLNISKIELINNIETEGLYALLRLVDCDSCKTIHKQNRKRIIRALEYYLASGETMSAHNKREKEKKPIYNFVYFVMEKDREKLYSDINKRVDDMIKSGLENEVKRLLEAGYTMENKSMQAIGYKEMIKYLTQKISFEEAVYLIKQNTRHYAKRQMTWFRREENVIYIDCNTDNKKNHVDRMEEICKSYFKIK